MNKGEVLCEAIEIEETEGDVLLGRICIGAYSEVSQILIQEILQGSSILPKLQSGPENSLEKSQMPCVPSHVPLFEQLQPPGHKSNMKRVNRCKSVDRKKDVQQ